MTTGGGQQPVRLIGVAGIAWGSVILASGPALWQFLVQQEPTDGDRVAMTLLGARHVVQGAAQVLLPGHFQGLEIGIDLVHTATMVGVAALDRTRRRPALVTAGVALASAIAGMAARKHSAVAGSSP